MVAYFAGLGRQQMADLSAHRVAKSPPFKIIGTDLMEEVLMGIGPSQVKRYVCIFNCLATRTVHLEIIPSLNANGFL